MSNFLPAVKLVSGLAIGSGVGSMVANIALQVPPTVSKIPFARVAQKTSLALATFAISGMITDKAVDYMNGQIDNAAEQVKQIKATVDGVSETETAKK